MIAAVIPTKRLTRAKSRLASVLPDGVRAEFVRAMLANVLTELQQAEGISGIYIVATEKPDLPPDLAPGTHWIEEPEERGYNAAVQSALGCPDVANAAAMLILPGDLPLLRAAEIDVLTAAFPRPGIRIAPDRAGAGTNALLLSPPDLMETRFGPGSFARHLALALAGGVRAEAMPTPGLAFDIDTPQDLCDFCARPDSVNSGGERGERGIRDQLRASGAVDRLALIAGRARL